MAIDRIDARIMDWGLVSSVGIARLSNRPLSNRPFGSLCSNRVSIVECIEMTRQDKTTIYLGGGTFTVVMGHTLHGSGGNANGGDDFITQNGGLDTDMDRCVCVCGNNMKCRG